MILLDTCAIVFASAGTLTPSGRKAFGAAARQGHLFISPISFWEIATLARKGRIALDIPVSEYLDAVETGGMRVAAVTPQIGYAAGTLDDRVPGDPSDRLLVATALALGLQLMTRDRLLLSLDQKIGLRVIAC